MAKKGLIYAGVALIILILVFVAFGNKSEGEMGRLAIECLEAGSVGPACDLYYAYVAVEEANQALAQAREAYNASKAPDSNANLTP